MSKETPEEKITRLEGELEATNQVNADLQNEIEEKELMLANPAKQGSAAVEKKPVIPSSSFKIDDQKYVFKVARFTNPLAGHAPITAEEALTNKELLAHLAEIGSGVIERKVK